MKRRGFIATSVLYSFFLVFVMVMISNLALDMSKGLLVKALKDDIQTQLDNEDAFLNFNLPLKSYAVGESVLFAGDTWQVIHDYGAYSTLVLARSLTEEEITSSLGKPNTDSVYFNSSCYGANCRVRACRYSLSGTDASYHYNGSVYNYYSWYPMSNSGAYGNSILYLIVENWLRQNTNLQVAMSKKKLIEMGIHDGVFTTYRSYIRIPTQSEATPGVSWGNGKDFHTLTAVSSSGYQVYIYNGSSAQASDCLTTAFVRPVVTVKEF